MHFAGSSGAYTVHLYAVATHHCQHNIVHECGSLAAASYDLHSSDGMSSLPSDQCSGPTVTGIKQSQATCCLVQEVTSYQQPAHAWHAQNGQSSYVQLHDIHTEHANM